MFFFWLSSESEELFIWICSKRINFVKDKKKNKVWNEMSVWWELFFCFQKLANNIFEIHFRLIELRWVFRTLRMTAQLVLWESWFKTKWQRFFIDKIHGFSFLICPFFFLLRLRVCFLLLLLLFIFYFKRSRLKFKCEKGHFRSLMTFQNDFGKKQFRCLTERRKSKINLTFNISIV